MFAVVYQFEVKENRKSEFINAWKKLTELIYEYEGSLGSRLHKETDNSNIAYTLWSERETWKNSGNNLPQSAENIRLAMKDCCDRIKKGTYSLRW